MKITFFSIILALISFGCDNSPADVPKSKEKKGEVKYYRKDGKLKSIVKYNDRGMKHGLCKNYYSTTGKLQFEINYKNGAKEGWTRMYFENGKSLYKETEYKNDLKHGIERMYYKDGTLLAEKEYKNGQLGVGLKEYTSSGRLKVKTKPKIRFKEINTLAMNGQFTLEMSVDPKTRHVEFFEGELTDGKFYNDTLDPIPVVNGVGKYVVYLQKGSYAMKQLNIVAKVKTRSRNYYLLTKPYHLAIDNKAL